jgi:thiol-disulfide isomerase/thioredoxin
MKRNLCALMMIGAALLSPLFLIGRQGPEELAREKILATSAEWQQKFDDFQPVADMVEAIKPKLGANESIEVYLGLWCPDSRNHVPTFLKFLDKLGTSVPVRYFGLPRKASKDVKYYFEEKQVEKVPTFIFFRDGKEIGRIIEKPKTGIVEDILDIVYK